MERLRPCIITGNWKMYKTIGEASQYVETLAPLARQSQVTVYLALPFTAIQPTKEQVKLLNTPIHIGAQNMNDAQEGAFTGEIAGVMLRDVGAEFVILGHSERRRLFHETNFFIHKKLIRALADGLQPILCVGETLQERQEGATFSAIRQQLVEGLVGVSAESLQKIIIAYEPVWAIGTGQVAKPEDAQAVHLFCRSLLAELWGQSVADRVVIQYGGSVNLKNAKELISQPDVDGLLIGGASLDPQLFGQIISLCQETIEN